LGQPFNGLRQVVPSHLAVASERLAISTSLELSWFRDLGGGRTAATYFPGDRIGAVCSRAAELRREWWSTCGRTPC